MVKKGCSRCESDSRELCEVTETKYRNDTNQVEKIQKCLTFVLNLNPIVT